jgi:hypothetical protein
MPAPLSQPFSDAALQSLAQSTLAMADEDLVPPGHRGAVVAVVQGDRLLVSLAAKVGDSWEVGAFYDHAWQGEHADAGQIKILHTW